MLGSFITAPADRGRWRALSEITGACGYTELWKNPRKRQSGHSREDSAVRAFLGERGFFLSITAHADKDLINDFWLLGWHFTLAGLRLAVSTHLSPRGWGGVGGCISPLGQRAC